MSRFLRAVGAIVTACALWATLAPVGRAAPTDIADRVRALPGVAKVVEEDAPEGFRFFQITFNQQVDHDDPSKGTFPQRLTLLHRDTSRPMVMYTTGYYVPGYPFRDEVTRLVDGNVLAMEYRFFEPSRPAKPDWEKQLTIKQAATDQHVIIESFKQLYAANWLTTGGSKGGMTATYHRRFFPGDVDGSVPYVAPNDVLDSKDNYDEFLENVGNDAACRDRLTGLQLRVLQNRDWFLKRVKEVAAEEDLTYTTLGGAEQAMESNVLDFYWVFWQYQTEAEGCPKVPDPETASNEEVWDYYNSIYIPLYGADDAGLDYYLPYYFQAAYQLGSPQVRYDHLQPYLKYPKVYTARDFVAKENRPDRFDWPAMADIDRWVRTKSTQMLFVNGGNDPWSAEPFECGAATGKQRECVRFTAAGGSHGAKISDLPEAERDEAYRLVRKWAGVADERLPMSEPSPIPGLDDRDEELLRLSTAR